MTTKTDIPQIAKLGRRNDRRNTHYGIQRRPFPSCGLQAGIEARSERSPEIPFDAGLQENWGRRPTVLRKPRRRSG